MQDIQEWTRPQFKLESGQIRQEIERQCQGERLMYADDFTKTYYTENNPFIWISRHGIDDRADSLVARLKEIGNHGLVGKGFHLNELEADLTLIKTHSPDIKDVNQVMGRLEYRLTQDYLRYTAGLRYGFVRPHNLLNNLLPDIGEPKKRFRVLFDINCDIPKDSFFLHAIDEAKTSDHISSFLREVEPKDSLYTLFQSEYLKATQKGDTTLQRLSYINMERARWRYPRPRGGKYVWVNLAGFELTAVDEAKDTVVSMVVCGGNQSHKTPLLQSAIERVETDPYWIIPMTIIRKEILPRHTGDTTYFHRNHYRIIDKRSGEELNPADVTSSMLTSGRYTVRQDNGAANSLGRLIFRFPNQFAVFLHDTNNHSAFRRKVRAVSHGCVRVARPLDLALFLMEKPDSILEDKIRMAIDLRPKTKWGRKLISENPDAKKLGTYTYPVPVPVYLDYYTLYPDPDGQLRSHPDVYHYDEEIEKILLSL